MSTPVIVTDPDTLHQALSEAVEQVLLDKVPDAIREANQPEWLSRESVCKRYDLTPRQLTYMRNKGRVEYTQHGRRILYNRASLETWIDEGRVYPSSKQDS